jgi:hypothetical protein
VQIKVRNVHRQSPRTPVWKVVPLLLFNIDIRASSEGEALVDGLRRDFLAGSDDELKT